MDAHRKWLYSLKPGEKVWVLLFDYNEIPKIAEGTTELEGVKCPCENCPGHPDHGCFDGQNLKVRALVGKQLRPTYVLAAAAFKTKEQATVCLKRWLKKSLADTEAQAAQEIKCHKMELIQIGKNALATEKALAKLDKELARCKKKKTSPRSRPKKS